MENEAMQGNETTQEYKTIQIKIEDKDFKMETYDLIYDEEKIKSLISEIINNCSIRRKTKSYIEARSTDDAKAKINSATDCNGNKLYENVSNISIVPVSDHSEYWRPGDPVLYSFISDMLVSPRLVNFLTDIINGRSENVNYPDFSNRRELEQKGRIQLKIQTLDSQINEISNFDTQIKIAKLQELAEVLRELDDIPDFDYDKLAKYYDIVEENIQLELFSETYIYKKKKKDDNQ